MPKDKVQPFIDSIRACYKDVTVVENEDGCATVILVSRETEVLYC